MTADQKFTVCRLHASLVKRWLVSSDAPGWPHVIKAPVSCGPGVPEDTPEPGIASQGWGPVRHKVDHLRPPSNWHCVQARAWTVAWRNSDASPLVYQRPPPVRPTIEPGMRGGGQAVAPRGVNTWFKGTVRGRGQRAGPTPTRSVTTEGSQVWRGRAKPERQRPLRESGTSVELGRPWKMSHAHGTQGQNPPSCHSQQGSIHPDHLSARSNCLSSTQILESIFTQKTPLTSFFRASGCPESSRTALRTKQSCLPRGGLGERGVNPIKGACSRPVCSGSARGRGSL